MPGFKKYLPFLLLMLSSTGCTYHEMEPGLSNTCSVQNPIEDLPWLREMVPSPGQLLENNWYIQQGTYKGQTVFAFNICCANCNYVVPVYDCDGVLVFQNLYVQGDVHPEVKNLVTIAKAEDFKCSM